MKVYYHAHNGTVLYVTPPIMARTKQPQPDVGPPAPYVQLCVSTQTVFLRVDAGGECVLRLGSSCPNLIRWVTFTSATRLNNH
jgi:hypothetical protein